MLGGGPARDPDYLGDLGGLAGRRTLVVPHLRGAGRTPLPGDPSRGSWWSQAGDVDALREHLGHERVTVLGHSAGTRIALAFAARFPGSLQRLVLVTPPAGDLVDVPSDVDAIRARRIGEPTYAAALAAARQGTPGTGDDDALTAWQRSIAPLSYAAWGPRQQEHATAGRWSAAAGRIYRTVDPPESFRADLAGVEAPVRIVAAAEDGVTGTAAPLALADLFRHGRAVALPEAGHYPWVDRPEDFLAAVGAALDD
ncbi:alpha/beta fold hydrolase [Amnibacterium kyonggiense]